MGSGYVQESHIVPLPDSPYVASESDSVHVSADDNYRSTAHRCIHGKLMTLMLAFAQPS